MERKLVLLVFGLCLFSVLQAQSNLSWKKHVKLADELNEAGEYAGAAANYEAAWSQKPKKTEYIFKAAEAYYKVKDYQNAANAYSQIKEMNDIYPLVGLKYARCLKQSEQYDMAIEAFRQFGDNYSGQSKTVLMDILQTEVEGCELGKRYASNRNSETSITLLSKKINSTYEEFAPFIYSDDILFFSSTVGEKAKIYRSQRAGRDWARPTVPDNFPVIANEHFCNGAMSPDGQRFYFNICDGKQPWGMLNSRCEIFVIRKTNDSWSEPQRLQEYINMEGITNIQPHVVHESGNELIYFASNREGGQGGMDLWYISRELRADDLEFTFPINLGPAINTLGDEISPYYDKTGQILYFSSNGQVTVGGFDVFKAAENRSTDGSKTSWSLPENLGAPLNSSADDFSYVLQKQRNSGFFVSNRKYGNVKTDTKNEDIFEFFASGQVANATYTLEGNVYGKKNGQQLRNIKVALFELSENGTENLVTRKNFQNGSYRFSIQPDKMFKVEIQAFEYIPSSYQFATDDPNTFIYGKPVYLGKQPDRNMNPAEDAIVEAKPSKSKTNVPPAKTQPVNHSPSKVTKEPAAPSTRDAKPASEPYTSRGKSAKDNYEIISSAPRHDGKYYKVQLIAVKTFDENQSRYSKVKKMGRLDTEFIVTKKLTRVLLADYGSLEEAKEALEEVHQSGFPRAYIIQYEDGERYGRVR